MICGFTSASMSASRRFTSSMSTCAISFFTTNHATGLRSQPNICIPKREPSTMVVPPPMNGSATLRWRSDAAFLVVGVINVPHSFGRFALVLRRFHCRREQHGAEDAGTPPRPPFRHLVDGLIARVALDSRQSD